MEDGGGLKLRHIILLIIITLLCILWSSCSYPMQIYNVGLIVPETIEIEFKTEKEAIRVQRRIKKHCSRPERNVNTLYLTKDQLQCSRKVLGNEYSFIREKYREQINKQLNYQE